MYSIFMLVEYTIMLNPMLTVVAKITIKSWNIFFWLTCGIKSIYNTIYTLGGIPMATADLVSDSDIEC